MYVYRLLADVSCGQYHCAVSMDEMKIKSGLVFNKHDGTLVGFTDLGRVNRDIEMMLSSSGAGEESNEGKLADQVLVFLARSVFKPSLSVPVAHYFCLNLKGEITVMLNHIIIIIIFRQPDISFSMGSH